MTKKNKLPKTIKILKNTVHQFDGKEDKHDTRPTESIKVDLEVENLVKSLPNKDISDLREMWEKYFNEKAPKWNKSYLILRLSYRIQEVHYATTLRLKVRKTLENIYKGNTRLVTKSKLRKEGKYNIKVGAVLERHYQGNIYKVMKTDKGYLFEEKTYKYLSAIATKITKKQTKGYEFFGLI